MSSSAQGFLRSRLRLLARGSGARDALGVVVFCAIGPPMNERRKFPKLDGGWRRFGEVVSPFGGV